MKGTAAGFLALLTTTLALHAQENSNEAQTSPAPWTGGPVEWPERYDLSQQQIDEQTVQELMMHQEIYLKRDPSGEIVDVYTLPEHSDVPDVELSVGETLERATWTGIAESFLPSRSSVEDKINSALSDLHNTICALNVPPSSVTADASIGVVSVTIAWETGDVCSASAANR